MQPFLKGSPARLAILDFGLFLVHENNRVIGISGYVVQTTAGETVLIDSGFPPKYAADAAAATREDDLGAFGQVLSIAKENLAPVQLALLGLEPDDVDLMIQSHTHIDHLGFMDAFPKSPIAIAEAERALPRPLYWSGQQAMAWPDAEYLLIKEDTLLGPGFEVLLVPGHTPGQLAFILQLPETGTILLTSDAISRPSELDQKFDGSWDADQAMHHAKRLLMRATQDRATIIYGHSPEQWPKLRKAPEWYT